MKIVFLRACRIYGQHIEQGQVDDVADKLGTELIAMGKATAYEKPSEKEALEPPPLPVKNRKWVSKKTAGALVPGAAQEE